MNSRRIRPASELQEEDFRTSPVWRFITPDESQQPDADESYVAPEPRLPGTGQYGSLLVAANYEVEGGSALPGVVQVDILDTRTEFTPATVYAAGKNADPLGHDAAKRLQRLLKTTDTQPSRWRLYCAPDDEKTVRTGSISKPGLPQALGLLEQLARLKRSCRGDG